MKPQLSDRTWILLILFVLVAEVLWLLIDLQIIEPPHFAKNKSATGLKEAGHVTDIKQELKRRGSSSLIWDVIKENEILYYNDSILTLSQSSAKIYLKDETDLQLSENTLVTLEEPSEGSASEIRLRFSKGDIRARNPNNKSAIYSDDWVVNLEKGSDVALRKNKDSYEFEVFTGRGTMQTSSGQIEHLTESSIIKVEKNQQIQKLEKNKNLQWKDSRPLRVYIFEDSAAISLDWTGSAKKININKIGEDELSQLVSINQSSEQLNLKVGHYKARLADENGLSTTRSIEVVKAPIIYLKKPLPRDRIRTGESVEFIWTNEKSVKEYQIIIGDRIEASTQNYKTIIFKTEQDTEWRVEAYDEEGFLIPSMYDSKIYIKDKTLQAPKLKPPSLRLPIKKQNNSLYRFKLWSFLIAEAYAAFDNNNEVLFEWEAVDGADNYTIEVSSDPDFRKPEVIESVKSTHFLWKKYNATKRYYWRVAAGQTYGPMGVFSEPFELKPTEEVPVPVVVEAPVRPIIEKTKKEEIVEKPVENVIEKKKESDSESASDASLNIPEKKVEVVGEGKSKSYTLPSGWALAWAPSFNITKLKGDENSQIQLAGAIPLGLDLEFKKNEYQAQFWMNSQVWKPKKEADASTQKNLSINEALLYISKGNLGMSLHQSFAPMRETNETITYQTLIVPGLRYSTENFGVLVGTSGSTHELGLDLKFKKYFFDDFNNGDKKNNYFYGVSSHVFYQANKFGGGHQADLIFLFGVDSF